LEGISRRGFTEKFSSACADGVAKEGGELIDGGCVVGDGLGRAEPAGTRRCGELGSGEGQCLLGQILGQFDGLVGGSGEVPAVGEEVGDAQLQPLGARGSPERAVVCPLEDSRLVERSLQRHPGVAVHAGRVIAEVVGAELGRDLVTQEGGETRLTPTRWLTRSCTLQSVHGVGADHWSSRIPAIR
jgi:hypothetical protein